MNPLMWTLAEAVAEVDTAASEDGAREPEPEDGGEAEKSEKWEKREAAEVEGAAEEEDVGEDAAEGAAEGAAEDAAEDAPEGVEEDVAEGLAEGAAEGDLFYQFYQEEPAEVEASEDSPATSAEHADQRRAEVQPPHIWEIQ